MSPGQRLSPADLGKAGCPGPPAATAGHLAQKGHQPEPLNRIPHYYRDSLPQPPGMIRSRTAASRAPAVPPRARSQNPGSYHGQGADSATPKTRATMTAKPTSNACGPLEDAGKAVTRASGAPK